MECPICMELPIEPQVGQCGHSICIVCKQKLHKNECPICKKKPVKYTPNFMLKEAVLAHNKEQYDLLYAEYISTKNLSNEKKKSDLENKNEMLNNRYDGRFSLRHDTKFSMDDVFKLIDYIMVQTNNFKKIPNYASIIAYPLNDERNYRLGANTNHIVIFDKEHQREYIFISSRRHFTIKRY